MQQTQPQPQINTSVMSQAELLADIDSALKEPAPQNIMTNRLLDEILYYITPIISLIGFILILVFGVIPNASAMSQKIQEVNMLKEQDTELKARIAKLTTLKTNITEVQDVINKLDSIVPEGKTEVVKFSQRIRNAISLNMNQFEGNSKEKSMNMDEIRTGEIALSTASQTTVPGLKVYQVPTQFTFSGGLQRFRQFFKNLYNGTDFFVVEEMNLAYDPVNQVWNGQVSLVKYQFNKDLTFNEYTVYGGISEDEQPNEKVVNFIKTKFVEGSL